jgi:bacterial/archaeal transporter family protein
MAAWFWYAVVAAVFYGAHQIFTRIAADHIGEGLGGFVVEASAAFSILIYLGILWFSDLGRRRRDHGYRWDSFLSRPTVVAKDRRCCVRRHWFILVT